MIRINLLPEGRRSHALASSAQMWGVCYLLSSFALCVLLFLAYLNGAAALSEQRAQNGEMKARIKATEAQVGDLDEVEARLAKSRELEAVAKQLQTARQGPARLLMELSRILSVGRGPTIDPEKLERLRRDNPLAGYNPSWDVRRLSLSAFKEVDGKCQITGTARTNEDVAEFLRRLNLSEFFDEVLLQSTLTQKDRRTEVPTVVFELSCKVAY